MAARKTSLLKHLGELTREELIEEIQQVCARFPVVKSYFEVELSGSAQKYLQAAKKKITQQFLNPRGGWRRYPKASRLNAVLKDFEQISIYKEDLIDLMLFRLEETARYRKGAKNISDTLLQSSQRAIAAVEALIEAEGLQAQFAVRTEVFNQLQLPQA